MRMRSYTSRLTALGSSAFAPPSSQGNPGFSAFAAPLPAAPAASAPSAPAAAVASATPQATQITPTFTPQYASSTVTTVPALVSEYGPQLADPGAYAYEAPPDASSQAAPGDGWDWESWAANLGWMGWLEIAALVFGGIYVAKKL